MRRGRAAFVRGEELAAAVRDLESHQVRNAWCWSGVVCTRTATPTVSAQEVVERSVAKRLLFCVQRYSIPFLPTSCAPSPVSSISRHLHQAEEYNHLGHCHSSSAGAMSSPHYHQSRDEQWQWKLTRSPSNGIIPVSRSRHLAIYSSLSARKYIAGITVQRSGPSSKLMSPHDIGLSVIDGYSARAAFDTLFERLYNSMLGMALKEQGEQGGISKADSRHSLL